MDPYAWMDVLVYLTSRVYPIDVLEWLTSHGQVFEQPQYLYREHVSPTGTLIGGTLTTNLYSYTNWPAEHVSVTGSFSAGTLILGLVSYANWPAEHVSVTGAFSAGTLIVGLVTYTNWPAEHVSVTGAFSGGTLA
jgi:hypothetical protein